MVRRSHEGKSNRTTAMSSHARRRLSEEGKRLLRRALHHREGDEDEDGASNDHLSMDFSVVTNRDDASADSDLEGFNELKGGVNGVNGTSGGTGGGGGGGGGRHKHKYTQHKYRGPLEEDEGHDELEEAIEKLTEKRDTTKIEALRSILSILCSAVLTDRIQSTKATLVAHLLTTLKKRMRESGALSLRALSVLAITVGGEEQAFYQEILQPVQRMLTDQSEPVLRIEAVYALTIACFVCCESQQKWELIDVIGSLIVAAQEADEETGEMEEVVTEDLLLALIECWGFLLSAFSPSTIVPKLEDEEAILYPHVQVLASFVREGMNHSIRSAACEVLALLIQYKYQMNEENDWSYASDEPMGSVLYGLDVKIQSYMRETGKSIGKKNRKIQRSMFKEVLETLITGEGPHQQIQIDKETLSISTWNRFFQANVFRRALQSGFQVHLYENVVLRDVFDVVESEKVKMSMISTVRRRADHRTKAIHKRNDVLRKAAIQSAFLYDE